MDFLGGWGNNAWNPYRAKPKKTMPAPSGLRKLDPGSAIRKSELKRPNAPKKRPLPVKKPKTPTRRKYA